MLNLLFDFCGILVGGAQLYLAYKVYLLSRDGGKSDDGND